MILQDLRRRCALSSFRFRTSESEVSLEEFKEVELEKIRETVSSGNRSDQLEANL